MTLDKMFYNLLFKQEVVAAHSYFHIFFLITFLEEAFNRIIIIIVCFIISIIIIIIGIQPLGWFGQRPEFSQATGMALVRCILGKFLQVACHCFPPLFRCSHFSPPGASTSALT